MRLWGVGMTALGGAAVDLGTKAWARGALDTAVAAIELLPILSLRLAYNKGVSFSLFAAEGDAGRWLLFAMTSLITLAVLWLAWRSHGTERFAFSLVLGGALGNLVDRLARHEVTDFLDLHFGNWHPFIFNLADVWITLGVVILLALQVAPAVKHRHQR